MKGRNAKSEILNRKRKVEGRERGRERKRKGKKEEGKGGKGIWKWSFGRNGKNRKPPPPPAENRARDPSKRGWCSTIEAPRQATSPASFFEILSVLSPLHNIGTIQCQQTIPASLGEPVTAAIVHRARPERIVIAPLGRRPLGLHRQLMRVCMYVTLVAVKGLSRCRLVGSCVLPGEDFFI